MSDDDQIELSVTLSKRKLLGGLGAVGTAGFLGVGATLSLLWDEETFGNANDPNVLQAGALDLKVDWTEHYVDWVGAEADVDGVRMVDSADDLAADEVGLPTPANPLVAVRTDDTDGDGDPQIDEFMRASTVESSPLTDQPEPVVTIEDVKPGDFGEVTFSYHVFDNPAFVSLCAEVFADEDNGFTEPEDKVDGHVPDGDDGTEGGDLGDHLRATAWYDPNCDNRITEGGGGATEEVEVMLATDCSESMDANELPGTPPGVDGETDDATSLEAIRAAVGDVDGPGFLSRLEDACPDTVEVGAVSFSENLEHLDNDADGDDTDDPAGEDADGEDAMLDKALVPVGATDPFPGNPNGGGYGDLKRLFGAGGEFAEDDEFVVDDDSAGTEATVDGRYDSTLAGNDDYVLGNGNDTFVAERPYTGDGDGTQDDGIVKAHQALLPDDVDGAYPGIDPSGNAAAPGDARKLIVYFTDGGFGAIGEDDPDPVTESEAAANAEADGIEIKPVVVNTDPSDFDVEAAENLATSEQEPVFVTQYDGTPASCDADVTAAGHTCTSLVDALDACLADVCSTAGTERRIAGPASIDEVLGELDGCALLNPAAAGSAAAQEFGPPCHAPSRTGCVALAWWLPRDIPDVNDNLIQTDRYEFQVGFDAIQCRHNVANDGEPLDGTIDDADAENNAQSP